MLRNGVVLLLTGLVLAGAACDGTEVPTEPSNPGIDVPVAATDRPAQSAQRKAGVLPVSADPAKIAAGTTGDGALFSAVAGSGTAIYDAIPVPFPGSYPSLGYQATQTAEFGDHVAFTQPGILESVVVGMNSWACENDGTRVPNQDACETSPGSTYDHDITLTLFSVDYSGAHPAPGPALTTQTGTFQVPFKPSWDDVRCTGTNQIPTENHWGGKWYDEVTERCVNGYAFTIEFDFEGSDIVLPPEVIYGIAYNTQTWGYTPIGASGPYNSLNVGVANYGDGSADGLPTIGSDVEPEAAFWNTATAMSYCDGGAAGMNVFRYDGPSGDPQCWYDLTPIVRFNATLGGHVSGGGWFESPAGAYRVPSDYNWFQGFESDAAGWLDADDSWYGTIDQVASGTNGITSSSGAWHAVVTGDAVSDDAPFSRFDGYRDTWPGGSWIAELAVYLDPAWALSQGFDYSVAANGSDGSHQRDYIFHVNKDASTGKLLVAGSNNTNFAPREDLENINHYEVTSAGWYTLQHVFRDQGGSLAVDLNLLDATGTAVFTETRYTAADLIPAEVGGNRYSWFTFVNVDGGIAVDDHSLIGFPGGIMIPTELTGKASFGFVSMYKKGASLPTGNTQFTFNTGDLNFHSTAYDWLVVNKGDANAQFKGTGTINGMPSPTGSDYKFMIWAGDGDPDTFRIKIWHEDGGNELVVYDNGVKQPIDGGAISIHKK